MPAYKQGKQAAVYSIHKPVEDHNKDLLMHKVRDKPVQKVQDKPD
jgi:hypothetical protein